MQEYINPFSKFTDLRSDVHAKRHKFFEVFLVRIISHPMDNFDMFGANDHPIPILRIKGIVNNLFNIKNFMSITDSDIDIPSALQISLLD